MTPPQRTTAVFADFPPVSYETWRQRVADELGGQEPESVLGRELPGGLAVRPLYTAENSMTPERVLPAKSSRISDAAVRPWRIAVEVDEGDPQQAAQIIERDLARGADLLWLGPRCFKPLSSLLQGVDLERVALVLDSGADIAAAASVWSAVQGSFDGQRLTGCLGGDPLGTLASTGVSKESLESAWVELAESAMRCATETPEMRAALVSAVPYHEAGATSVDELACAMSAGMEALRRLTAAGLDIDRAASQVFFAFAVGSDLFLEIAKLRAARLLWAKVVAASGGGKEARRIRMHARSSETTWAARAPWLNLLRGGIEGVAAAVSGVWSLAIQPFDTALGRPIDTSRRLAISTQHLLAEESHLGRVADPAAGSWYVEDLTAQLARAAWQRCREIERCGGLTEALVQGKIQAWAEENSQERLRAVAHRQEVLVGVSEFAHLEEKTPVREAVPTSQGSNAGSKSPGGDALPRTEALPRRRYGQGFEALRRAAEEWQKRQGRRPAVGLLGLGPLKEHAPRANFARAFFAPGGVEALPLESAEAFDAQALDGVVLCGSDERYAAEVSALVPILRQQQARWIFLAGKPKPEAEAAFRRAGVEAYIFHGADVLGLLATFLGDLGVGP